MEPHRDDKDLEMEQNYIVASGLGACVFAFVFFVGIGVASYWIWNLIFLVAEILL